MALPRALKILAIPPAVVSVGWFFSCFLLLATSTLLLQTRLAPFPKENPAVLAADDQREQPQLTPSPDEQTLDERITTLEQFLNERSSPLATHTAAMVEAADNYKFDWRLLPAIAGKESSYGKNIPWESKDNPSYNAWGWGVYGQEAPIFSSWEEAIESVAAGLRHEYYNEGYITPELIVKKFAPRSDGSWERDVTAILEQIAPEEQFFPL